MLTQRANVHHHKIPDVGKIGYLIGGYERYTNKPLYYRGWRQRWQVVGYPLNDNAFGIGIHTAFFRNLQTGSVVRMSGFYFEEMEALREGNV